MSDEITKYAGIWGGRTDAGEEMWWSAPNAKLRTSKWHRFWFRIDLRHYMIHRFLRNAIADRNLVRIVDFGCGTGGTTINFANLLQKPIEGFDIFETQLKIARIHNTDSGSNCIFAKLNENGTFPLENESVDIILNTDVLGHVPDIYATVREFYRVLKRGGAAVFLTEAGYSARDQTLMARLAREGLDMTEAVPEHISMFPREQLEEWFVGAGFKIIERYSANVFHFFFFPRDYVKLLKGKKKHRLLLCTAWLTDRLSKIIPFYPKPLHILHIICTRLFGKRAYGTGYYYYLMKP
jgi:ubiquinone/menaquinone biosynthesis C-methylase UbiE